MSSPVCGGLLKPKQKPKGRSANGFVERNFTPVEKLSNNSNRWKWRCNHCPSNAALVKHPVDWTAPLEGPESILLDEIEAGFYELERHGAGLSIIDPELDRNEITVAQVYDLEALNVLIKAKHHMHMKKIFICTEVGMGQCLSGIQRQ
ncbi:hypothetical protein JB92DRAFT_2832506 [Gautieria morchelliformis]|nr:hypothetical protein JB92DRAFT_2832506 [Gautieria morchelliformis]